MTLTELSISHCEWILQFKNPAFVRWKVIETHLSDGNIDQSPEVDIG